MIHSEAGLFNSCAWISDQEAAVRSMTHRWIEQGINAFREKCDMKLTTLRHVLLLVWIWAGEVGQIGRWHH